MRFLVIPLALCLSLASFNFLYAQCPPNGIYDVGTQTDVDAFAQLYPNCTELSGYLRLEKEFNQTEDFIIDLSPFGNLTTVKSLYLKRQDEITSLGGLENLTEAEKIEIVDCNGLSTLNGLNNMVRIRDFSVRDCPLIGDFSPLSNLQDTISLSISEVAPGVDLSTLPSGVICDAMLLYFMDIQSLDGLPDGFIFAENTHLGLTGLTELTSIGGPGFPDIMKVVVIDGCSLLTSLNEFNNVQRITSTLFLRNNQQLESFGGFNSLTELGHFNLTQNPLVTSLPASFNQLTGLKTIYFSENISLEHPGEAFSSLTQVNTLSIDSETSEFCEGFQQLNRVGHLNLSNCNLTDLSAFSHLEDLDSLSLRNMHDLTELGGIDLGSGDSLNYLIMYFNDQLENLYGLPPLARGTEFFARYNPQLSFCGSTNICGGYPYDPSSIIANNAQGCSDIDELLMSCNFNVLITSVFYDANGNLFKDSDEPYIPNSPIDIEGNYFNHRYFTDAESGKYVYTFLTDTFTVSTEHPFLNFNPAVQSYEVADEGNNFTLDFAATANEEFTDLRIFMIPTNEARPGFIADYELHIGNQGNSSDSGEFTLFYDADKLIFDDSGWPPIASVPGELTWTYTDLPAFGQQFFALAFSVYPPPGVMDGDVLNFSAQIPAAADIRPENNFFRLDQTVVNGYDPNDKQVNKGEEIFIEEVGDYFHYLIRFQNTGTASAINVRIEDTLSTQLDWSTFEPLSYSHPAGRTTINENGEVAFIFDNIMLPDSTSDFEGSNGYVSFRIRSNDDLELGDVVENTAHIYFDFNEAIITNTAITRVVEPSGLNEVDKFRQLSVFPNPAEDLLTLNGLTTNDNVQEIIIYDHLGRKVTHSKLKGRQLNVSELSPGFYHLRIELIGGETGVAKFIKQ
ncbi:hypothetical protein CEQ90_11630 [Lewinellaceae bacterium SD302]|nr:hypothetical protein CEQ90_11630 [Lewinellaceae bacterium SD302]